MTLKSKFAVTAAANLVNPLDLGEAKASISQTYLTEMAHGVAAGQADRVFHDQRTIAASGNEDLDLAGVLTDPLGAVLTFARIKGLIIKASAANTNNVVVGGAAANGFLAWVGGATHTVTVRPGGVLALLTGEADATGYPVTAGTGDLLRVANSGAGTAVTYDVIILGTSA